MGLKRLVIRRAKVLPRLWQGVGQCGVLRVLREDDGQACLQVPVDVAVEEPRARVIGLCR